ncbi:hypothetical protein FQA39_LY04144 [Lamprigera yunnana]|nr:hypothetical protein FQA39_LY04144 [Lamprigera yunnana]
MPPRYQGKKLTILREAIVFSVNYTMHPLVTATDAFSTSKIAIWPKSELERLQRRAQRPTEVEIVELKQELEKQKLELERKSKERRDLLQKIRLQQRPKPGSKLFTEETRAAHRGEYILQRAFELRQEEEGDVKRANSLILTAKCLAIREAQICEKEMVKKELKEHEHKLDAMMEEERLKGLKVEEERRGRIREFNKKHDVAVSEQIQQNEMRRLNEVEEKQKERNQIQRAVLALKKEEQQKVDEKRKEKLKIREEIRIINDSIIQSKVKQREEERIASLKIQEFMRKKCEREAAQEAALERTRLEKSLEIAKIQAHQQKTIDFRELRDEMNALQVQEEVERVWREKELDNAANRRRNLEEVQLARRRQMEDIRRSRALEMQREKEDLERALETHNELYRKEVAKRRRRREEAKEHCKEILRQIDEKELKRVELQNQKYLEGKRLAMEQETRNANIKKILRKKVDRLKQNDVPQSFIVGIEKELKQAMPIAKFLKKKKFPKPGVEVHTISECDHKLVGKYIHYKPLRAVEGKPMVALQDTRLRRNLIVSSRDPVVAPAIWGSPEANRLKKQAYVVTNQEKMALVDEAHEKKVHDFIESEKRTDVLRKATKEQKAKPGSKLFSEETGAADKNMYVLQRAFELRQEQEDEVKRANSVILAAKCLTIRKQQIVEKQLIKKEWAEEVRRLDDMMEQGRQKALKEEEERKRVKKEMNQKQVQALSQQIYENEVQRLIELEQKEEESRHINKALIAMQRDDAEKVRQKKLEHIKTRDMLNQANKEIENFKVLQRAEQRVADMRLQEFVHNKAEREAKREAELAKINAAKEREKDRLIAEQVKAQSAAADEAELLALRIQEEKERQWREAELAAALKKKQDIEVLINGRAQQMKDIRRQQALNIEKDRSEFFKVAKVQREEFNKYLENKKKRKEAAVQHRKDLLQQINEKELYRIGKVKHKFEEGRILRMEQELRNLNIKGIIKKKIQKLHDNHVPQSSISDVERQLKV